ncbi:hypothetical protein F5Y15DRAFT_426213 [Xylariaceae sp. FL0016]|nr:hypothetical protein F5Y15DRAFT_426213 [Xylariaceae sp. FL0016]
MDLVEGVEWGPGKVSMSTARAYEINEIFKYAHTTQEIRAQAKEFFIKQRRQDWKSRVTKYFEELALEESYSKSEGKRLKDIEKHQNSMEDLVCSKGTIPKAEYDKKYARLMAMKYDDNRWVMSLGGLIRKSRSRRIGHKFYGFMSLPREIRYMIYNVLLAVGRYYIPRSNHISNWRATFGCRRYSLSEEVICDQYGLGQRYVSWLKNGGSWHDASISSVKFYVARTEFDLTLTYHSVQNISIETCLLQVF